MGFTHRRISGVVVAVLVATSVCADSAIAQPRPVAQSSSTAEDQVPDEPPTVEPDNSAPSPVGPVDGSPITPPPADNDACLVAPVSGAT